MWAPFYVRKGGGSVYHGTTLAGLAAPAAALPYTGVNLLFLGLAAFAMLAAGASIMRLVPRRSK